MTVKELKEQLNKFDDNLIVMIPDPNATVKFGCLVSMRAKHVSRGTNSLDGFLFIDDYVEDDGDDTI